jgi:hypothetical protein
MRWPCNVETFGASHDNNNVLESDPVVQLFIFTETTETTEVTHTAIAITPERLEAEQLGRLRPGAGSTLPVISIRGTAGAALSPVVRLHS